MTSRAAATLVELARFTSVAFAGLTIDLGLAWTLAEVFNAPLVVAAAAGFAAGAGFNYLLHELWTFRRGASKPSVGRALRYAGVLGLTLAARLVTVAALVRLAGDETAEFPILIAAAGVSFGVNYIASRTLVFSPPAALQPPQSHAQVKETRMLQDPIAGTERWETPDFEQRFSEPKARRHALVIPVINEGERIRGQLRRIHEAGLPVDVVVADGGSTDGSLDPDFLRSVQVRALLVKTGSGRLSAQLRMAYAWCLREGYEGIVTVDGNGKDGVEAVQLFVDQLEAGYDYVQGSRYLSGGVAENTPLERTIGNRLIHAPLLSLAGRHWFTDTTNGFRGYSAAYLCDPRVAPFRDVFQSYELLFYLTVRAGQLGYHICEAPVKRSYPVDEATPTKINGLSGKAALLRQTVMAALGAFRPKKS
jgi:putative flippase GtrA